MSSSNISTSKGLKKSFFGSIFAFMLVATILSMIFTALCVYGNYQVRPGNQSLSEILSVGYHVAQGSSNVAVSAASVDNTTLTSKDATGIDAAIVGDAVSKALQALQVQMQARITELENEKKEYQVKFSKSKSELEALRIENTKLLQSGRMYSEAPLQHVYVQDHARTSPNSDHIGGVAVAILLHSPKWFQRRYTMMVNNIVANIPDDWKVQIFYADHGGSQKGIDLNVGLQKLVNSGKLVLTLLPREMVDKYQSRRIQYMVDPWIWNSMLADRVLVFGGNSVMCGNSPRQLSDFFEYDYVGSPWRSAKGGMGGDGGISYRNRKVMLEVLHYKLSTYPEAERAGAYKSWGMEDVFFVNTMLEMRNKKPEEYKHIRLAPREVTMKWGAIGEYVDNSVLTASGTLGGVKIGKNRSDFIDHCLELKMLFPVLHDPGCFGAQVDKEACAASICALSGKKSC